MKHMDSGVAPGNRTVWWWLALLAVVVGIGLRVWQWSLGTTMFMDELAIVHNVVTRSAGQLVSAPLVEAQVAPPLFLVVEKACWTLFGSSELSLRLPPLLASVVALLLFWPVARHVLDERLVPLALLTFAVGVTFVHYSNQVKQYASDAAVGLLILYLALRLREVKLPSAHFWVLGALAGLVLPFYSQASLMYFAGCGAALVLLAYFDAGRPRLRVTLTVVAAWAVGCVLSLALAQNTLRPIDQAFMHYFWREGMLPLNVHLPIDFTQDLAERWANGLGWPHPASIWVGFTLLGVGLLWWQHREVALLLTAPWVLSTLAALLHQFPLRQRLMDFLVPTLILFVFVAFQAFVRWAWRRSAVLGGVALGLCLLPILYSTTRHNLPPFCVEDAKTLYAKLAQVRRPTDAVYAYYGAGQYLRWYGPQYGLRPASYKLGHCYRHFPGAERNYLKEVDAFRGRRVWLVMMHFDSYEEQDLNAYLSSIGQPGPRITVLARMPDESVGYKVSYAQLYDLTDAKRAARFSAATFPLVPTPERPADEICWSCYGPQAIANNHY
ncbi:glycosyltransferase family 39 protein [Hymenobacter sp. GOD-10R]|uniref:glycosyltransferase family 39 protein n=1 Tax=Hymenobacter sp. GOD-10R TaxID=3093922 RepID=UPI002D768258|nr:glycosyltransferase family 39 protein [Hymenobacter sp. GOD-10R]WRQ26479.1 glycosyltransferase family 39 protein [Hymenobacter sp. GOD-10R]